MGRIQEATHRDIPPMVSMLVDGYASEFGGTYSYNEEVSVRSLLAAVDSPNKVVLFSKDDIGRYIGGIGGVIYNHPWSGELYGSELFWYVHVDHRNTGLGRELLTNMEDWMRSRDVVKLVMTYIKGPGEKALKYFYKKEGFKPLENQMIREISHGS